MTGDELRNLQAPLKARYKAKPDSARYVLKVAGRLEGEDVTCTVKSARGDLVAGLHPATGGDGSKACSADLLLEALVGCAGVTLKAVATALAIPIRHAEIRAEADLDFRGTLGVAKDVPVGMTAIRLVFDLDVDAAPEQRAKLIELTERYCVVYQTLKNPPSLMTQ